MANKTFWINDFSGGLKTKFRQNVIADNESPALRNARFLLNNALSKRLGTTRIEIGSSSMALDTSGLKGAYSYRFDPMGGLSAPLNDQVLIASSTEIVRSINVSTFINFLSLNNKFYIFNNTADSVRTLDNTNATGTVAAIPNGSSVAIFKGTVFVWGNFNTNVNRLQWSSRNDPETWPSSNFEDIDANDGNIAAGIYAFGNELILFKSPMIGSSFKNSKMYRISGDTFDSTNPTYTIEQISMPSNIGLVGHRTLKIFQDYLIFMTNTGFYAYRGGGQPPEKISTNLGLNTNSEANNALIGTSTRSSIVYQDKYYCSSNQTDISYNGQLISLYRVFVLDENGKWWQDYLDSGSDSNTMGGSTANDWFIHNENLYSISSFSNLSLPHIVRQWETSGAFSDQQDDGTSGNVNFSYSTKEFNFLREAYFKYCYLHLRRQSSGTLTFSTNIDQRGESSVSIDMTAPDTNTTQNSSSRVLRKLVNIGNTGQTIQFRLHDRGNNDVEVYAIELIYDFINIHDL